MRTTAKTAWLLMVILIGVSTGYAQGQMGPGNQKDIRKLSQHFLDPKDSSPWIFGPQNNIKSVSLTEHPGFATIWHGAEGKDIKGVLNDPIKIDDYPLPWEFHLGVGSRGTQSAEFNWAIGLNLVLTFSDPSTWPKDRTQLPPDTHSFQLLVSHLKGPQIESGPLNYYSPYLNPPDADTKGHGGDPYVAPSGKRTAEVY